MKVSKPTFSPFNITITIENTDDLKGLYHRLKLSGETVMRLSSDRDVGYPYVWTGHELYQLVCEKLEGLK